MNIAIRNRTPGKPDNAIITAHISPSLLVEAPATPEIAAARARLLEAQGFCWAAQMAVHEAKGSEAGKRNIDTLRRIAIEAEEEVGDLLLFSLALELAQ